jgi:hypothetical protein
MVVTFQITVDDAQELLAAACLFQFTAVIDACCSFLSSHLHPANCLGIEYFAQLHACVQLEQEARRFAKENFTAVAEDSDEFVELTAQRLESYISSDDIEVRMEEMVFEAVVRWVNYDVESRRNAACGLLRHVRFTAIDSDYVNSKVRSHHLIAQCQNCLAFVADGTNIRSQLSRPSTIAKEVMVVVGGYGSNGVVLDSVEAYIPSKDCWQSLASVPVAVACCAVASAENDIFISGGIVNGKVVAEVWRFISAQQQWAPACPLLAPRAYHASAAVGTRVYVVGGKRSPLNQDMSVVETIECIDIADANSRWRVMASVPFPRHSSHMAAYGSEMFVEVGGMQVGAGAVRTMETYNFRDKTGHICYSGEQFVLPETIRHAQIAAVGGILYIIWTDDGRMISLNSERRIFRRLTSLHYRHLGGRVTVLGGCVYMTGGSTDSTVSAVSDVVEFYDADTDKWTDVRPMTHARRDHGCVTISMR